MARPLPALVVGGFMGTGKSTVASLVAARAGVACVDLDRRIEAEAGIPIATIFRERGEAAFRALEAELLERTLGEPGPRVVAVGGGALVDPAIRRRVLGRARVVTLTADVTTILSRCAGGSRPLLAEPSNREARVLALLEARAPSYAETHATIATDDRSADAVADAALAAWSTPTIAVPLGLRTYTARLASPGNAPGLLADAVATCAPSAVFVITDENVRPLAEADVLEALAARGARVSGSLALAPGESNKQLAAVESALRALIAAGADRDVVVVSLGGGMVSDVAGFAAATFLRGVRWIVAPTTLLAMVDASVGGKTGVDVGLAKNAAGAFHQPSAVVIGPSYVATEPARSYVGGLAEVVKTGAIGDPGLLDRLDAQAERVLARDPELVEELVLRALGVKAGIVSVDEREAGVRAHLNFGHTVGHALEAEGGYSRLTHGEAVSLGMVAMLRAGRALGVTPASAEDRIVSLLARLGLPTELGAEPLFSALPLVAFDKKRRDAVVRAVLLRDLGDPVVVPLELTALRDALR